ncbi:restriction endonuclease [Pseudomonas aeruginosa]|nr:restriction endonuclease [Pseudomonas aeruginosa]
MYLPALKNAIQNLEEKLFYDVALMYLTTLGYQELSMVDGTGDGGRDVTCSREDLRIQLSVRRDWRKKINEEASNTERSGHRHLIYVTNKIVSPDAEQEFIQSDYSHRGTIDLSIHDLKRIVTALSRPGVIRRAYELLNMAVPSTLEATPKDIALSTLLLFSQEANELREAVINANTRAHLFKNPGISENVLIGLVENSTPGTNVARAARGAISQLRTSGRIVGSSSSLNLSPSEQETMKAAEAEFLTAAQADVTALSTMTSLSEDDSRELLNLALNLLIRGRDLNGTGPTEEALRSFIAKKA